MTAMHTCRQPSTPKNRDDFSSLHLVYLFIAPFSSPIKVRKAENSLKATSLPCQLEVLLHHHFLHHKVLTRRESTSDGHNEQGWVFPYLFTWRLHQALMKETSQTSRTVVQEEIGFICNSWTLLQTLKQAAHGFVWNLPQKALLSFLFLFFFLESHERRELAVAPNLPLAPSLHVLSTHPNDFSRGNRVQIGTNPILCFVTEGWFGTCSFRNMRWTQEWGNER